jgi:DNA invertase Pin-like site-specific DNA recombinase
MDAYSYLRVSGKGQLDGDGFDRQREAVAKYAASNGITRAGEYRDEGVSGTKELAERDGLTELFQAIDTGTIRLVLVERADRLARDLMIGEIILVEFRKRGVQVIEVEGGSDLTVSDDNPTRKLVRQLLGAVAEFEKAVLVAKLRAARSRRRRQGTRCEGRKPFGYRDGEQAVVERIKVLRADGCTLSGIASELNQAAVPTRSGARWHAGSIAKILDRAEV